ncbi:MAG TPA: sigma-70 family RNA polymerase sigma factor, partial [Gemmatimonadaceae bacterium]|nr:sigma-70 family RNA polymerase sigma factor [Gemmatimonadaceae bacterium]
RRNDYRRLRKYSEDGRGTFTTWLVAVVRRLCVDEHRQRYGRAESGQKSADQQDRRQLVDLLSSRESLDSLEFSGVMPDSEVHTAELKSALDRALAVLDVRDRLLLRLRYEDDLGVPEIARLLSEPSPFRVYRQLEKILGVLRRELQLAGIDGSMT